MNKMKNCLRAYKCWLRELTVCKWLFKGMKWMKDPSNHTMLILMSKKEEKDTKLATLSYNSVVCRYKTWGSLFVSCSRIGKDVWVWSEAKI
jgi:hypothetical protein